MVAKISSLADYHFLISPTPSSIQSAFFLFLSRAPELPLIRSPQLTPDPSLPSQIPADPFPQLIVTSAGSQPTDLPDSQISAVTTLIGIYCSRSGGLQPICGGSGLAWSQDLGSCQMNRCSYPC